MSFKTKKLKRVNVALVAGIVSMLIVTSCRNHEIIDPGKDPGNLTETTASFKTKINETQTRASGTMWEKGDEIGLFSIYHGETLSSNVIFEDYFNIKYINNIEGSTAIFNAGDKAIKFPSTPEKFDFIAYYPYSETGVDTTETGEITLDIDISSQEIISDIDVMYASASGYDRNNPNVELHFNHMLSQLVLKLTGVEGVILDNATIEIDNVLTHATMNLADGSILNETVNAKITPNIEYNSLDNTITVTAILLPGQNLETVKITIVTADARKYEWTPDNYEMATNVRKTYNLKLSPNKIELLSEGFSIGDWTDDTDESIENIEPDTYFNIETEADHINFESTASNTEIILSSSFTWNASVEAVEKEGESGYSGDAIWLELSQTTGTAGAKLYLNATSNSSGYERSVIITFIPETEDEYFTPISIKVTQAGRVGDGTEDNPYNILQAIEIGKKTDVWVQGYIVGRWVAQENPLKLYKTKAGSVNLGTRIFLASDPRDTEMITLLPLLLAADTEACDVLNLFENFDKIGRVVKILCNLDPNVTNGTIPNVLDYELIN